MPGNTVDVSKDRFLGTGKQHLLTNTSLPLRGKMGKMTLPSPT